ncbi:hypothetical protein [Pseudonocardia spinosispora]|uniref:hypothetical protein n=1 Tax=Pseudonocardia spinosispora TaxID=103441 RepID=UPI0006843E8D|nr:hypothetical protein [Pseudonocardia spinosispora]
MSEVGQTEADGEAVLAAAVDAAVEVFGDDLDAAFALGSLAHGGFAPLVSDVDIAFVLRGLRPDSAERIARVGERARTGSPLARRLSIFWTDWAGVRGEGWNGGRLPQVDRLDLVDSGRLLHGVDRRGTVVRPGHEDLVLDAARFAVSSFDADYLGGLRAPGRLLALGVRSVTKSVLFPVRFLYTLHTGRLGLNEHAASWYRQDGRPGEPLVSAASRWRLIGVDDDVAAPELLDRHLGGIYRELFTEYADDLAARGHADLAGQLRARGQLPADW